MDLHAFSEETVLIKGKTVRFHETFSVQCIPSVQEVMII